MTSVISNDITVTAIEKYIISTINSIKSKKQRAVKFCISHYTLKHFQINVSKSDIVKQIEILLKNSIIINKQFNGKNSYKINKKETIYDNHGNLQRTNDSYNNACKTSDSNVNKNVNS